MPYVGRNTLIARPQAPLSGFWDVLEKIGQGGLSVFQSGEQAKGAAAVLAAQQAAAQAQANAGGGISTTTLLMIGGIGIAAVLLLKRKKSG